MIPCHLQKWYFDLITTNGHVLYLYFIAIKVAGIRQGQIAAHLTSPEGNSIESSCHIKPTIDGDRKRLVFGENVLLIGNESSHVQLRLPRLSVDLQYSPVGEAWMPGGDGMLIKNRNHLIWRVPYPRAIVEGSLRTGSSTIEVSGIGYHDFVDMTIPLWRLSISELLWGRAHCGSFSVIYDQIKTKGGDCLQHFLLREERLTPATNTPSPEKACEVIEKAVSGRSFNISSDAADRATELTHDTFTLHLQRRAILDESSLATDDRIRPKLFKQLLIHTAGEAVVAKMLSDACLHIGKKSAHGLAIHERVSWV